MRYREEEGGKTLGNYCTMMYRKYLRRMYRPFITTTILLMNNTIALSSIKNSFSVNPTFIVSIV